MRQSLTRQGFILLLGLVFTLQVLPLVSNPSGPDEVHLVVDVNGYFE